MIKKLRSAQTSWSIVLTGIILLTVIALSGRWMRSLQWNAWSIQFLKQAQNPSSVPADLGPVPLSHEQANVWLAREAFANHEPDLAIRLLESPGYQNDPYALLVRAAALEGQGKYAAALQALTAAGDNNLLIDFADRATRRKDWDSALAAYRSAWNLNPEMSSVDLAYYLIYHQDDPSGAEAVLKQALVDFPKSTERASWYRYLGEIYRMQKNFREAETVYQTALDEYPRNWTLYVGLGWLYYDDGGQLARAKAEFQKAIDLDKSRGDGYFAMAQLLTRDGKYAQADNWYVLAIDRDQENISWYIARGNNARSAGEFDKAISVYQEAIQAFPASSLAYYELSQAYLLGNKTEKASQAIEKAISMSSSPNAAYFARAGQIYEQSGNIVQALKAYQKALSVDPQNALALKGAARLGQP